MRSELQRPSRVRSNVICVAKPSVVIGYVVTRGAAGLIVASTGLGGFGIDCERITRGANHGPQVRLSFDEFKIEIAVLVDQWRAETERREQVAPDGGLCVPIPMHPASMIDVP